MWTLLAAVLLSNFVTTCPSASDVRGVDESDDGGDDVQRDVLVELAAASGSSPMSSSAAAEPQHPNCTAPHGNVACPIDGTRDVGEKMTSWNSPTNEVIASIVTRLKWKSVVIVFDEEHEPEILPLTSLLSSRGVDFMLYHHLAFIGHHGLYRLAHTGNDAWLQHLHFLLLCSVRHSADVLRHADQFQTENGPSSALSVTSRWLIQQEPHVTPSLDTSHVTMMHVAILYCRANNACCSTAPSAGSECGTVMTLLWATNHHWLTCVGDVHGAISGKIDIFPGRRWGFNQRMFKVSTLPWVGFVHTKLSPTGDVIYSGLCIDLLQELSALLNFTYTISQPEDGIWGLQYDNGTWAGLVGDLANHKVDMVVAPLTVTQQRESAMDFTYPFFNDADTFIYRKPDPSKDKWKTYFRPLKWQVLVLIGVCLLVTSFLLGSIESWTPFYPTNRLTGHRGHHSCYFRSFRLVYGALLAQADDDLPRSASGRLLVSCWWLFCIVVAATYSGNLIAFLTVDRGTPLFQTLTDLTGQSSYRWGFMHGSAIHQTVQASKLRTFHQLWAGVEGWMRDDPHYLTTDPDLHYRRILQGQYAFLSDKATSERWAATRCDLDLARETFLPIDYGVGLPNQSAFTRLFSTEILSLHENGLLGHLRERWWSKNSSMCEPSTLTRATEITLVDIQSAFYLLAVGCTVGALSLAIEVTCASNSLRRLRSRLLRRKTAQH